MDKRILFIQGGGDDGYEADKILVDRLQTALSQEYALCYPKLYSDEAAPDFGWTEQIGRNIHECDGGILVGHSLGASMLLKYLSEHDVPKMIKGIFLLATPFWSGNEDWKAGLKLRENFAEHLPGSVPVFLYHCEDDEEVSFNHLQQYREKLDSATFRELKVGGHQFTHDLGAVADDIRAL